MRGKVAAIGAVAGLSMSPQSANAGAHSQVVVSGSSNMHIGSIGVTGKAASKEITEKSSTRAGARSAAINQPHDGRKHGASCMVELSFLYQNAKGEIKQYFLSNWAELGNYVEGFCSSAQAVRTFRKDRVITYGHGCERLLRDPFPEPPPNLGKRGAGASADALKILFTGFPSSQRSVLEMQAAGAGMHVRNTMSKSLHFLCVGPNAGPSKVRQAREQGTYIVDQAQFMMLLEAGELPDDEPDWLC